MEFTDRSDRHRRSDGRRCGCGGSRRGLTSRNGGSKDSANAQDVEDSSGDAREHVALQGACRKISKSCSIL